MNVKLLNRHIYEGVQLVTTFADRDVPFHISYACGKSLVRLREQFQFIESERQKIIKKYQEKNPDGTPLTKKSKDSLGNEIDVPALGEHEAAATEEIKALQDKDVEIDVHSITLDSWNKHMQAKKCKECKRGPIDVSSNAMAALIQLGILVDDEDKNDEDDSPASQD